MTGGTWPCRFALSMATVRDLAGRWKLAAAVFIFAKKVIMRGIVIPIDK